MTCLFQSRRWLLLLLLFTFCFPRCFVGRAADAPETVLTNALQVRALKRDAADRHFPVKLSGVVMGEAEPEGRAFVMWDGTAGIYLLSQTNLPFEVRQGDLVEVTGVSDPGGFAPIVVPSELRKTGRGEIPDPQRVTYDQLAPGRFDGQWVEISGVVRSCVPLSGNQAKSKVVLATGGERLVVQVNEALEDGALVDDEIRLTGICFNTHNISRQLLSPLLLVPRGTPIAVEKSAPPDPYTAPVSSLESLMRFETLGSYGHRVHVRGTVTHYRTGEFLWIHDGGRGLRVQTESREPLHIGDEVDVVGFLSPGGYTPVLEDATFRKGTSMSVPVADVLPNAAAALEHDADLVQLRNALLSDMREVQDGLVLTLDWHGTSVRTLLRLPNVLHGYANWRLGSKVNATGICSILDDKTEPLSGILEPQSFQLLLRSPADLSVVRASSWWTLQRVIWLLALATGLLAGGRGGGNVGGTPPVARRNAAAPDGGGGVRNDIKRTESHCAGNSRYAGARVGSGLHAVGVGEGADKSDSGIAGATYYPGPQGLFGAAWRTREIPFGTCVRRCWKTEISRARWRECCINWRTAQMSKRGWKRSENPVGFRHSWKMICFASARRGLPTP